MIHIAILGFGKIGSGTAEVFDKNADIIAKRVNDRVNVKHILDLYPVANPVYEARRAADFSVILNDPEVSVVVETMGGSHPAFEFSRDALLRGKSVVTSNKEVVANFGPELFEAARKGGSHYLFEASVGGGIPVIRPMANCLAANRIDDVRAIVNGTTNYILTVMRQQGISFEDALKNAQGLGYAEADPSADVDGLDACRKICILGSLAFGSRIAPDKVRTEGIRAVTLEDIRCAERLGMRVKLIAEASRRDGVVSAMVAPRLVSPECPLYGVEDVFNGVMVTGNVIGDVMFYGRGAGSLPTASAVAADVIDVICGAPASVSWDGGQGAVYSDAHELPYKYYINCGPRSDAAESAAKSAGEGARVHIGDGNMALVTGELSPAELASLTQKLREAGASPLTAIRLL